jgi:hypothetical protein
MTSACETTMFPSTVLSLFHSALFTQCISRCWSLCHFSSQSRHRCFYFFLSPSPSLTLLISVSLLLPISSSLLLFLSLDFSHALPPPHIKFSQTFPLPHFHLSHTHTLCPTFIYFTHTLSAPLSFISHTLSLPHFHLSHTLSLSLSLFLSHTFFVPLLISLTLSMYHSLFLAQTLSAPLFISRTLYLCPSLYFSHTHFLSDLPSPLFLFCSHSPAPSSTYSLLTLVLRSQWNHRVDICTDCVLGLLSACEEFLACLDHM